MIETRVNVRARMDDSSASGGPGFPLSTRTSGGRLERTDERPLALACLAALIHRIMIQVAGIVYGQVGRRASDADARASRIVIAATATCRIANLFRDRLHV